ncbi:hypothetical protein K439DRAFT_30194 [Ramaria rubella]|nr:hypothetical protein K439DRAFT_30194 [Ramaria rubella]
MLTVRGKAGHRCAAQCARACISIPCQPTSSSACTPALVPCKVLALSNIRCNYISDRNLHPSFRLLGAAL